MVDGQSLRDVDYVADPAQTSAPIGYMPVNATDVAQFAEQIGDWNFEVAQLAPGEFNAIGAILSIDGISITRIASNPTLLFRGFAPPGMIALIIPGAGSGAVYMQGQLLEAGQCATMAEGALLEGVSQDHYLDVSIGFDVAACHLRWQSLDGESMEVPPGTAMSAPGTAWLDDVLRGVDWLFDAVMEHPQCLGDQRLQESLSDHVLSAMARFENSPTDVDSTTHSARAGRRAAVRLARDYIHSRLSEPLQLSELCRHANLKIRSLEYGFREVTGLTPVAYIRSLRLNAVRKALLQKVQEPKRSISQIAMDVGFWHLSQFAADYRRFFGETPTETRRRCAARWGIAVRPERFDEISIA